MAKQKDTPPAADSVPPVAPEAPPVAPPAPPAPTRYEVSLPHALTVVVEADSPEAAWREYMRQQNITASIHTPSIKPICE